MARHPALPPIAMALLGVALFSVMDALMKGASLAVGAYSALLIRNLFGIVLTAPAWHLQGGRWPRRDVLRLHLLRGSVTALMGLTFFYALTLLPLAEAIALAFIAPLIALYLAAIWLGEKVGRPAILASLLGLVGVVAIALGRLEASAHDEGVLLGIIAVLVSAVLYAWNLVLQRRLAQVADPWEVATFQSGVAASILLLGAPWFIVWPQAPEVWGQIAGSALLGVLALVVLAWAYRRAEAQVLVPLEYSGFLWAALLGWLVFDEAVTLATVTGTLLIVAACWIAVPRRRTEPTAL